MTLVTLFFYNYYYIYLVYVCENKTFLPARVGIL